MLRIGCVREYLRPRSARGQQVESLSASFHLKWPFLCFHCIIIIEPLSMCLVLRELIHLQILVFPCEVRLYSMFGNIGMMRQQSVNPNHCAKLNGLHIFYIMGMTEKMVLRPETWESPSTWCWAYVVKGAIRISLHLSSALFRTPKEHGVRIEAPCLVFCF